MTRAGITRVVTMDLHAGQIQGFFDIPVDHLGSASIIARYINQKKEETDLGDLVVVSPDLGGVTRARDLADRSVHLSPSLKNAVLVRASLKS